MTPNQKQLLYGRGGCCYWPEESLLEDRETPRLPDEHVGDLADLYADEEHGVARVLLVQPLTERLHPGDQVEVLVWWYKNINGCLCVCVCSLYKSILRGSRREKVTLTNMYDAHPELSHDYGGKDSSDPSYFYLLVLIILLPIHVQRGMFIKNAVIICIWFRRKQ